MMACNIVFANSVALCKVSQAGLKQIRIQKVISNFVATPACLFNKKKKILMAQQTAHASLHSQLFFYANCPGLKEAKPVVCFTVEHTVVPFSMSLCVCFLCHS